MTDIDKQRRDIREGLAKGFYYRKTGRGRWEELVEAERVIYYLDADAILAFLSDHGLQFSDGSPLVAPEGQQEGE